MKRSILLPLLCVPAGMFAATDPNVVFIYVDDLGFGDISVNGAHIVETPNIDSLADMGINFTNSHSSAAVSTPSRYGLLTGEYPWRKAGTGILPGNAGMIIRPDRYTIADMFKENGYRTAAIGKWHLGIGETAQQDWNGTVTPNLSDIGFEYSYLIPATADRCPTVFVENGKVVNLSPDDPLYVSYKKNFEGEPTGKDNPELLRMGLTAGHTNSILNGISRIGYQTGGKSAMWRDEDIADVLVGKMKGFISENRNDKFFLYFATNDIHVPRMPNERFQGSPMGLRGDVIRQLDWTVGEVVRTLKENGLFENTIIVFASDNGPVLDDGYADGAVEKVGDHKISGIYRAGKASVYEGGTRVPMMVVWPGHIKPRVCDALVAQIDLFASLASLLDFDISDKGIIDSQDHAKTIFGKASKDRDYLITMQMMPRLMMHTARYKYIEPAKSRKADAPKQPGQLYDLKKDPSEKKEIGAEKPEILQKMSRILQEEKDKGFQNRIF